MSEDSVLSLEDEKQKRSEIGERSEYNGEE